MSIEQNKTAVTRIFMELWSQGNFAVADELIADSFVNHAAPPGTPPGALSMKQIVGMARSAAPDCYYSIEDMLAIDDKVVVRATLHGTQTGPLFGIAPTGRHFDWAQMHIIRLADGKMVEHWAMRDDLSLMQQLGALPTPARA